jgi:hypothetical protein
VAPSLQSAVIAAASATITSAYDAIRR